MPKRARDIDELAEVYVVCRMMGHSWEPEVTFRGAVEGYGRQICDDHWYYCQREVNALPRKQPNRKRVISSAKTGALIDVIAEYTDGYLLETSSGRGQYKREARLAFGDRRAANAPKEVRRLRLAPPA